MPHQFNRPEEIEGLDEPMISPHLVPPDSVQEWDTETKRYILRKRGKYTPSNKQDDDYLWSL